MWGAALQILLRNLGHLGKSPSVNLHMNPEGSGKSHLEIERRAWALRVSINSTTFS